MPVAIHSSHHRPHGVANRIVAGGTNQLVELLVGLAHCERLQDACEATAAALPADAENAQLAVGVADRTGMCVLRAVSRRDSFDRRSELVRAMESALDEVILKGRPILYRTGHDCRPPAKTHGHVARLTGCRWIVSAPLTDSTGHTVGGWMIFGERAEAAENAAAWLNEAGSGVAAMLRTIQRAEQGVCARGLQWLRARIDTRRKRVVGVAVVLVTLLLALLPIPYRVSCPCTLEPVKRRFIAAPFDGTLQGVLVQPGDTVRAGQPVARLDGREIRWEMASLQAAYEQADKTRDSALADRDTAAAQLARLEMDQIQHRIALLENRQQNLEIKSPLEGIVISGDLERVEGAPVVVGQTLFEIAPLDEVIVEVAVDESEISHIHTAGSATIRLDAFPSRTLNGVITRTHPRAELRDGNQVFIAEVPLANEGGVLRPGMRGWAKVSGPWASLGWIVLHRPFQAARQCLGW